MPSRLREGGYGPVRQLILQATSFCNIACRYCYLDASARATRAVMSDDTADRAFRWAADTDALADEVDCRWHAGEPLTRGLAFYENAHRAADRALGDRCRFRFSIQTNGMLIDRRWCEFFNAHDVEVGISLDGPGERHDRMRVDRRGKGTLTRVRQGIDRLVEHGVPFSVICVLSYEAMDDAEELFHFFRNLGCASIGFNTDDFAPAKTGPSELAPQLDRYRAFIERMTELEERHGFSVRVRELDEMRSSILATGGDRRSATAHPFSIVSVGLDGAISTCSPELLTLTEAWGKPWILGNVWTETPDEALRNFERSEVGSAIELGTRGCERTCEFFTICGGGSPVNRLYEVGSFAASETFYCASRVKVTADVLLRRMEQDPSYAARAAG